MTNNFLTSETIKRVDFFFAPESREEAIRLLNEECSRNLPLLDKASPVQLERFHFAVIKLSKGNLDDLREAIDLAKLDWRDMPVVAGFANSVKAHLDWQPKK